MPTHVIVGGHLRVDPATRADYLAGCLAVVERARSADGCLDFAISADPIDPGRINVYERWESQQAVDAFRGSGPDADQTLAILDADVTEWDASRGRRP